MLEAVIRQENRIQQVREDNGALFLELRKGVIRLMPVSDGCIRVSYTDQGFEAFQKSQGLALQLPQTEGVWEWKETEATVQLKQTKVNLIVQKDTGSILYEDENGNCLLQEAKADSKIVEEYPVYKALLNENTQTEEIQTADGKKIRIKDADYVFDKNLCRTRLSLQFAKEEVLFGLGQAEEGVWNLRNTAQYLHPANLKIALPVLLSNRQWGIFINTQSLCRFEDTQYGSYMETEGDVFLDYFFMTGYNHHEIVKQIRSLTGKAVMLPKWSFGYIQSQERYESEAEILQIAETFREKDLPLDAIVLDWMSWDDGMWGQKSFDKTRFPNPAGMIEKLHEMGVHFMISIWPNMTSVCENHKEFKEQNLLLTGTEIYNAFSDAARKLYWKQVEQGLFQYGIDGFWCDSSEPLTPEWTCHRKPAPFQMYQTYLEEAKKSMPIELANAYGYYHARSIYEGQRSCTDEKRVLNLTRSGYLGSQKYGTILWSGDISASFDVLRKQITAGLQFCSCGLPYWTLDIGAFFVKKGSNWFWNGDYNLCEKDPLYRELYVRWFQYGAFLPIFRSHGTDFRREPWNFGDEGSPCYEILKKYMKLRYRLMPYLYSLAGAVWKEDRSMMYPLVFDFSDDENVCTISDQYMLGENLMVCPVTEPISAGQNTVQKKIYLPRGNGWYDFWTNDYYEGGQWIQLQVPLSVIPVFVRSGAILPMMEEVLHTGEKGKISLFVYAGCDGKFSLYEDSGDGYAYEKGEYCITEISYSDKEQKVYWEKTGNMTCGCNEFAVNIKNKIVK